MEKIKKILINASPYILILMLSIFGTYVLFYPGLGPGDDYSFHIAHIYDEYKSLISDYKLSAISGNLAMGIGAGDRLFYSPLPHFTVAIIAVIIRIFGANVITAYKIVTIFGTYISGIFMYRLAMHISSDKKAISLLSAGVYILFPYRIFCIFDRFAFAEAFSFIFLPLFFMGLYDLVHMKKVKILPFLEIIIGGGLLYLSHNITAFYMFVFGIIYLLCNCLKLKEKLKDKSFVILSVISAFLLLGISSIAWASQSQLMRSDIYNLTDREVMWTDLASVLNRLNQQFSHLGLINVDWLQELYPTLVNPVKFHIQILLFVVISVFVICLDVWLNKNKYVQKYRHLISLASYALLILLFARRLEICFSAIIVFTLYLFVIYIKDKDENETKSLKKSITFWFCICSSVFLVLSMSISILWKILPQVFLNIQFPWRLWSLVQLFMSVAVCIICMSLKKRRILQFSLIVLIALCVSYNNPLPQKRLDYETVPNWDLEITDTSFNPIISIGCNSEYIPKIITDESYNSPYENSLHSDIRYIVINGYNSDNSYSIKPAIIVGKGDIEIIDAYSPWYEIKVNVSENSTIQMPLIYYPGYAVYIKNVQTGDETKITPENIEGLISFELDSGEYEIKTDYEGTTLRKLSFVWFYISIVGVILLAVISIPAVKKKLYSFYIEKKEQIKTKIKQRQKKHNKPQKQ